MCRGLLKFNRVFIRKRIVKIERRYICYQHVFRALLSSPHYLNIDPSYFKGNFKTITVWSQLNDLFQQDLFHNVHLVKVNECQSQLPHLTFHKSS